LSRLQKLEQRAKKCIELRGEDAVACFLPGWAKDLSAHPRIRMEKIIWPDRVRNEVLHRVKKGRNILYKITRRKVNWIGHIFSRNCLWKHVIEGKIKKEGDRSDGKTRKKM
jgi:hypothetical protein